MMLTPTLTLQASNLRNPVRNIFGKYHSRNIRLCVVPQKTCQFIQEWHADASMRCKSFKDWLKTGCRSSHWDVRAGTAKYDMSLYRLQKPIFYVSVNTTLTKSQS